MSTTAKVILSIVVILLVVLGATLFTSGGDLQGRLNGGSMELSDSSPSGSRSVSASDDFLFFAIRAGTTKPAVLNVGDILKVTLKTDVNDINATLTPPEFVDLLCHGSPYGKGEIIATSTQLAVAEVVIDSKLSVSAGSIITCRLNTDTAKLLDEDAGLDDPLNVTLKYNASTVTGNVLKY